MLLVTAMFLVLLMMSPVPPAVVMFTTITTIITTITTSPVPPATVMFVTTIITTTITIITTTTTVTMIMMILLCVAIITAPACLHEVILLHLPAAIPHSNSIQDIGTELIVVSPRAMMARLARLSKQCNVDVWVICTVAEHYIVVIHLHTRTCDHSKTLAELVEEQKGIQ